MTTCSPAATDACEGSCEQLGGEAHVADRGGARVQGLQVRCVAAPGTVRVPFSHQSHSLCGLRPSTQRLTVCPSGPLTVGHRKLPFTSTGSLLRAPP